MPSKSDIQNAVDDSLMFIFDCIGKEGRLWRIKKCKANPLTFRFLQDVLVAKPNKSESLGWQMIGTLEIEQMSRTEKLQAMELLWRSMSTAPDKLELPGSRLASRKAAFENSPQF